MNMHCFPVGRDKKEQKERFDAWLSDLWARGGEPKYQRFGFAAGRDKPIYHDVVTGMVRALDWLADEPYADASRFVYCGCSQGGGFGIYLTSLWGRFRKSLILCPNMCDMLAYKAGPATSRVSSARRCGWCTAFRTTTARSVAASRPSTR